MEDSATAAVGGRRHRPLVVARRGAARCGAQGPRPLCRVLVLVLVLGCWGAGAGAAGVLGVLVLARTCSTTLPRLERRISGYVCS